MRQVQTRLFFITNIQLELSLWLVRLVCSLSNFVISLWYPGRARAEYQPLINSEAGLESDVDVEVKLRLNEVICFRYFGRIFVVVTSCLRFLK